MDKSQSPNPRLRRTAILVVASFTVLLMAANYFASRSSNSMVHKPSEARRREMKRIEGIVDQKDPQTVAEISFFFHELVQEEDDRTVLLQQRASSLLGTVSVVITVILASVSLLVKDVPGRLKGADYFILGCLVFLVMLVLGTSLFWIWNGFAVRSDFATHNLDDFVSVMGGKDADLRTFKTLLIIENLQIREINAKVNSSKAVALSMATGNLFGGLVILPFFCLFLLVRIDKAADKPEVNRK